MTPASFEEPNLDLKRMQSTKKEKCDWEKGSGIVTGEDADQYKHFQHIKTPKKL